jgi:hypothetical protein
MLKCGKKLGIIYSCSFVIFLFHERKVNIDRIIVHFFGGKEIDKKDIVNKF